VGLIGGSATVVVGEAVVLVAGGRRVVEVAVGAVVDVAVMLGVVVDGAVMLGVVVDGVVVVGVGTTVVVVSATCSVAEAEATMAVTPSVVAEASDAGVSV